jgi:CheY-specific phosphatase CheX
MPKPMDTTSSSATPAGDNDALPVATSVFDGLVLDVTRALFDGYGVKLDLDGSPVSRILPSVKLISTIGFSSETLGGSLLLAITNDLLVKTSPAPDVNLADWCGELANQLLGRLKNQLLKYGVVVNLALPVVLSGGEFHLPSRPRPNARHVSFVSEWGYVFIRTEMELSATAQLVRQPEAAGAASMDEGEFVLF